MTESGGETDVILGTDQTLLPCTPEAYSALERLRETCPLSQVTVSVNSYFSEHDNTACGWYVKLPADTSASVIPFPSNMFEGVTVVETMAPETEILDFLKNKKQTLEKVSSFARRYMAGKGSRRASWYRCRPERSLPLQKTNTWHVVMRHENLSRYTTVGATGNDVSMARDAPLDLVPDDTVPNYIDSAEWDPELSNGGSIGLYHQWYTNTNGKRELKMYIVCHSSCQMAGLEIKQIVNDIPRETTAYDLATSEEIWWLESVNARNRNRLIAELADKLGIQIPLVQDCHAARQTKMAQPLTQTLIHGIYTYRDGCVGIANECIPTCFVNNGIVCKMSPWEGFFIFKGPHANTTSLFGTSFGSGLDTFPVTSTRLNSKTEPLARKMRYIVQASSPTVHDFWEDPSCPVIAPAKSRGSGLSDANEEANGGGNEEEEEEEDRNSGGENGDDAEAGFLGVSDPDLFEIALSIWRKTKRRELSSLSSRHVDKQLTRHDRMAKSELSYLSFDDHVVLNRLTHSHWDQRYGILRLVPLCLFTNSLLL